MHLRITPIYHPGRLLGEVTAAKGERNRKIDVQCSRADDSERVILGEFFFFLFFFFRHFSARRFRFSRDVYYASRCKELARSVQGYPPRTRSSPRANRGSDINIDIFRNDRADVELSNYISSVSVATDEMKNSYIVDFTCNLIARLSDYLHIIFP